MSRRLIRSTVQGITNALVVIATVILIAIVIINGVNVVGRYVFSSPLAWGEEVMLFLMIPGVFLATPAVTWDGAHIRMDLLVRSLPLRFRRLLEAVADLTSLGIAGLMVYVSVPIVLQLLQFDQRSDAAEIPVAIPQGAVPIGFTLVAIALIARELSGKTAQDAAAMHELELRAQK